MSKPIIILTAVLTPSIAMLLACGPETPHQPAAPPVAPLARTVMPPSPPGPQGTVTHACPGIDRLDTTSKHGPCTEMGCMNGFSLTLYPSGAWPHGKYRFVFKIDGATTTCDGRLPLAPCGQDSITCDSKAVGVGESGCALPPSHHSFGNIGFEGYPSVVDIDVFRDEALLTHAHYDVAYSMDLANGPGCEPACCSAQGALTLPKAK
jgi:hypothetical protein